MEGDLLANSPASLDAIPVRTAVRFPIHVDIVLSTPEREYKAVTEDVSANGILFSADELPPIGTSIDFELTMPAEIMGGPDNVVLHCSGRIVRHTQIDGRCMAAAVIDEYSLKAEQV
jgi:hypothetical protein